MILNAHKSKITCFKTAWSQLPVFTRVRCPDVYRLLYSYPGRAQILRYIVVNGDIWFLLYFIRKIDNLVRHLYIHTL